MKPLVWREAILVVFACVVFWFLFDVSGSVTLLDVLRATEEYGLVRFIKKESIDYKNNQSEERENVVYLDLKSCRFRLERRANILNDCLEGEMIQIDNGIQGREMTTVSTRLLVSEKDARDEHQTRLIRDAVEAGLVKRVAYLNRRDPDENFGFDYQEQFFGQLRKLQISSKTTAINVELDGRKALKFSLEESNTTTSLWVDASTRLPMKLESEFVDFNQRVSRCRTTSTDFTWDPVIDNVDRLFDTTPPEGFTVENEIYKAEGLPPQ